MDRDQAYNLVKKHVKNKNLRKHMLASEAVMTKLAENFDEDKAKWGLAGLVHDIDYDQTVEEPEKHGLIGAQILEDNKISEDVIYAVKAHNKALGFERKSLLDKSLYTVDPLTGLIVAAALIHPEKKLSSIDKDFVLNRFKEKHFAKGANREQIQCCSELGMNLEEFVETSLKGMQGISKELGL